MSAQNVLITSPGGNVGLPLVKLLLKTPSSSIGKFVLPTRNRASLVSKLPASASEDARMVIVEGDVSNPIFLEQQLRDHSVQTVLLNVGGTDELFVTMNSFDVLRRVSPDKASKKPGEPEGAALRHVVYMSVAGDLSLEAVHKGMLKNVDAGHMAVKFVTEQKLKYGGLPFTWTVLGPTLFFSNDLRSKGTLVPALTDPSFKAYFDAPLPDRGVSRVDPDDIALVTLNAIKDQGARFGGKKVAIGSRKMYTLDETVSLWSEALGVKVDRLGSGADALRQYGDYFAKTSGLGPMWGLDLSLMFQNFREYDYYLQSEQEYREQVELLDGKEPSDYAAFVKRTSAEWKKEAQA